MGGRYDLTSPAVKSLMRKAGELYVNLQHSITQNLLNTIV